MIAYRRRLVIARVRSLRYRRNALGIPNNLGTWVLSCFRIAPADALVQYDKKLYVLLPACGYVYNAARFVDNRYVRTYVRTYALICTYYTTTTVPIYGIYLFVCVRACVYLLYEIRREEEF